MGYIIDVLMALPIGIIYNMFISKISDIMTKNDAFKTKVQKELIIMILGAIVAFVVASLIFGETSPAENRATRYGLYFGSVVMLINSILFNWDTFDNDTKLFVVGFILITIITVSYRYNRRGQTRKSKKFEK